MQHAPCPAAAAATTATAALALLTLALIDGPQATVVQAEAKPSGALDPNNFKPFKLMSKENLTPNTWKFRCCAPLPCLEGILMQGKQHL